MNDDRSAIDWSLTTWEGSRREQIRRWSQLTMDEILAAQEEMAALAEELRAAGTANVREEPPPQLTRDAK
jgi:hypothetical protein